MPTALVGTSGFQYRHWRERFYPADVPQRKWLQYYSERFRTIELNVTFYRLPDEKTFIKWRDETPPGFIFSLKGSRLITHFRRLRDAEEPLRALMKRAAGLGDKLGVLLWQLPPAFPKDIAALRGFLRALGKYGVRNTFEFRDESWIDEDVFSLLKDEGQGLCMADWPPFIDDLPQTSGFVYIRRHGRKGRYDTRYSEDELRKDARRIRKHLRQRLDVFVYFNNDAMGYAPQNAGELAEMLRR